MRPGSVYTPHTAPTPECVIPQPGFNGHPPHCTSQAEGSPLHRSTPGGAAAGALLQGSVLSSQSPLSPGSLHPTALPQIPAPWPSQHRSGQHFPRPLLPAQRPSLTAQQECVPRSRATKHPANSQVSSLTPQGIHRSPRPQSKAAPRPSQTHCLAASKSLSCSSASSRQPHSCPRAPQQGFSDPVQKWGSSLLAEVPLRQGLRTQHSARKQPAARDTCQRGRRHSGPAALLWDQGQGRLWWAEWREGGEA